MKCKSILLCTMLTSCSFFERANEFKGHGRIDLLFPFDLIPGLDSILPRIALDVKGGFEWHNDAEQHQHEIELLRLQHQYKIAENESNEWRTRQVFLERLRSGDVDDELQYNPYSKRSG